ncbi:hypothetical protein B0H13DRAFT_2306956 [Mycena leptocephala]|nr:hypothetical protein B0H13DRAFT_2306956 [Mycena leptocephala]
MSVEKVDLKFWLKMPYISTYHSTGGNIFYPLIFSVHKLFGTILSPKSREPPAINKGANVDAGPPVSGAQMVRSLIVSSRYGYLGMVRLLLEKGAIVNPEGSAHLIPIYADHPVPRHFKHAHSLDLFAAFYITVINTQTIIRTR